MAFAIDCINDITAKISAVTGLGDKTFSVYSEEDLLDKAKFLKLPAVGVMYEGMASNGGDPSRQGLMVDLRVALVLLLDGKSVGNLDRKNEAARVLDLMRQAVRTTSPPTKHKWAFMSETPEGELGNVLVYVQRWTTAVPITN